VSSYVIKPYVVEPLQGAIASTSAADRELAAMRWFVPDWTVLPLSPRRCLVRNRLTGASAQLSSGEHAVLSACESCRTLEEHAARAARQLSAPPAHRPAINELLERCARQGLLVAVPDLVARFGPPVGAVLPPPEITITSADRPKLVKRLLTSAAKVQESTGAAYRWHFVDDSRSADARRGNREAIASVPALDVTYHDLSLAESLEAELIAAFPSLAHEISSLLMAARQGELTFARPVHYVLLRFAGRRFLHLDDDVVIEPRRPPLSRGGAETTVTREAAYWYESLDAGLAACPEIPLDPFAEHARWLGMPMADAWRQAESGPGGHRIGEIPPPLGAHFAPQARVVFTGSHVLGDPGWGSFSSQQLIVARETLDWLAAQPEAVRYAFESQIHWRGRPALHLAPQAGLSTTTLSGFDDSVLIPPSLRAGRAMDTTIGEMTRSIHPTAWEAILPFALPHVRDTRRNWLNPEDDQVLRPGRLLVWYARRRSASLHADGAAERLTTLGSLFVDLGGASDATLIGLLEEQAADRASRILFGIHQQLDDASVAAAWKDTLRSWLGSPLLRIDAASLRKYVASLDEVRSVARDYGRTLVVWPRLWEHCRDRFQGSDSLPHGRSR
jgi:hypothetical protein